MSTEPSKPAARFYWTGGTMPPMNRSYIERRADQDLFEAIKAGDFCYVLTSRQMGKSSLVSRAAGSLRGEGFRFGFIDLSGLGKNLTAHQWFDGMLERLGDDFDIEDEIDDFRAANANLGPQQMWQEVIRRVLLQEITGRVVIVIDEIDYVRSITAFSTDELFTGIRELYNRRSRDPELERLSFCLMGVASPADLIENKDITPFNIGHRIELRDFTAEESLALADGLTRLPPDTAREIVSRVFYWTGGQPYLTQKICAMAAADEAVSLPAHVDRIVAENFLSQRARETDDNLTAIRDRIDKERTLEPEFTKKLLGVYRRVLKGGTVEDSEVLPEVAALKLTGLVRGEKGWLIVKNPIYRENFNSRWISDRMPKDWARMAALWGRAAAVLLLIVCPAVAIWALRQRSASEQARASAQESLALAQQARKNMEQQFVSLAAAPDKSLLTNGKRIVESVFARKDIVDRYGLLADIESQANASAAATLKKLDADSDDETPETSPSRYFPGRELKSWFEPAGSFIMDNEVPVLGIIPWWPQPGLFVLEAARGKDERWHRIFFWDMAKSYDAAEGGLPRLSYPARRSDWPDINSGVTRIIRSLAVSQKGDKLLLTDLTRHLYVAALAPSIQPLTKQLEEVDAAAFMPDGNHILVARHDGPLVIRDLVKATDSNNLTDDREEWDVVKVSADGTKIAAAARSEVLILTLISRSSKSPSRDNPAESEEMTGSGRWKTTLTPVDGSIADLAFSPDGKRLAIGFWTADTETIVKGGLKVVDTTSPGADAVQVDIPQGIESLDWSSDGARIALGTRLGSAVLLEAVGLKEIAQLRVLPGSRSEVTFNSRIHVCFSASGTHLVAGNQMGELGVWKGDGSQQEVELTTQSFARGALAALPDGRMINAGLVKVDEELEGDAALFQITAPEPGLRWLTQNVEQVVKRPVEALASAEFSASAFSPGSGIIALACSKVSEDDENDRHCLEHIILGRARKLEEIQSFFKATDKKGPEAPADGRVLRITHHMLHPAGQPLPPRRETVADPAEPQNALPRGTELAPTSLALSDSGQFLAVGFPDGEVALLRIELGEDGSFQQEPELLWLKELTRNTAVTTLSFISRGGLLLAGDEKKFITYRTQDGSEESQDQFASPVAVGGDDLTHLVRSGKDMLLVRASFGSYSLDLARRTSLPESLPSALALSPDLYWQAAGLEEGSICISVSGKIVETIPAFHGATTSLAFTPDGRYLVAGNAGGWLRTWKLLPSPQPVIRPEELMDEARKRWSVNVSDTFKVVHDGRSDLLWRSIRTDAALGTSVAQWWQSSGLMHTWFTSPMLTVSDQDIAQWREQSAALAKILQAPGLNMPLQDLGEDLPAMLKWQPAGTPADDDQWSRISDLPAPLHWIVLSHCLSTWKLTPEQAGKQWLQYAELLSKRLELTNGRKQRDDMAPGWQKVFDEGIQALQQAVQNGSRDPSDFRRAKTLFDSPEFASIKARLIMQESKSEELTRLHDALTDDKSREQFLQVYDKALQEGYETTYVQSSWAYYQARLLKDYSRSAAYLVKTASFAKEDDQKSYIELSWSYLEEQLGDKNLAIDHARASTRLPTRVAEAWRQRTKLESYMAAITNDKTALKACMQELDKASQGHEYEAPWNSILLRNAKYYIKVGMKEKTHAHADEVFRRSKDVLSLYEDFWEGVSYPEEADRVWALAILKQGVEEARRKQSLTDKEKENFFFMLSRLAAHYRSRGEHRQAINAYKEAYDHTVTDYNKGWILTELGDSFNHLGLYDEALKCFVAGLPNDTSFWAKDAHANLLSNMGRFEDSLAIRKALYEAPPIISSEDRSGLAYGTDYAGTLRLAGRLTDALDVLLSITAPGAVVSKSKQVSSYSDQAYIHKRLILQGGLTPVEIASHQTSMLQALDHYEQLNSTLPEDEQYRGIWLPWLFHGDLAGTESRLRAAEENEKSKAADGEDPSSTTSLRRAALAAIKKQKVEALVQLAISLSNHWYSPQVLTDDLAYQDLAALPEVQQLIKILSIKTLADLPLREDSLAAWMESLPATTPEHKKNLADTAASCRQLAAEDRKTPLKVPFLLSGHDGAAAGAFYFEYDHQPEPGLRIWTPQDDTLWTEGYPSGRKVRFGFSRKETLFGGPGLIVQRQVQVDDKWENGTDFEVFFHLQGVDNPSIYFRQKITEWGPWRRLGTVLFGAPR